MLNEQCYVEKTKKTRRKKTKKIFKKNIIECGIRVLKVEYEICNLKKNIKDYFVIYQKRNYLSTKYTFL